MTTWVFEKLAGAAVRRDPNETQLFKTEQAEEGEYAGTDALVREILQNSMDASTGNGPVRIRLALHDHSELPARERLSGYFSRLRSPLEQREVVLDSDGVPKLSQGFLVCEDFGTRGLGGDPLLAKDPAPGGVDGRQDFFWFWRNIGRSGKTGDDLGRWGLGKTVYRAASQVGCMLGLTIRAEDRRELLMGQAVLKIHEHEGTEYFPEGYWCAGRSESGLPLPIENSDELARFRNEWRLSRTNEPGLSVVVPYPAAELKGDRILEALCVNFFVPILRGELIVDLYAPDCKQVHLTSGSIEEWCRYLPWGGPKRTKRFVAPPIGFAERCLSAQASATPTSVLGQTKMPELGEDSFDASSLTRLRSEFSAEKLVPVRVKLALPRRQGPDVVGELVVFVQRRPEGDRTDTYYIREGMTITKLNSRAGTRGVDAFVLVDRLLAETGEVNPLASLLGDSEGPAHEDWDTSEERPNRTWTKWKGRVKFCRRIVDNVVEVLSPPSKAADFELLSDFFSIEKTQAPQRSRAPGSNGHGTPDFGAITAKPRWYRLDGRRGGFRIASNTGEGIPAGAALKISVAYDLPSGNPLRKWSTLDFEFGRKGNLKVDGEGVLVKKVAGNVLRATVKGDKFFLSADGFDENRDLLVRIDEEGGDSQSEDTEEL